jgi:hypothetical protein
MFYTDMLLTYGRRHGLKAISVNVISNYAVLTVIHKQQTFSVISSWNVVFQSEFNITRVYNHPMLKTFSYLSRVHHNPLSIPGSEIHYIKLIFEECGASFTDFHTKPLQLIVTASQNLLLQKYISENKITYLFQNTLVFTMCGFC